MELTESIESINQQLIDLFGIDTITGLPMYRVVFSEDQLEKRLTQFTDSGLQLLHPEVRLLPKYRQWIQEKYVLENLVVVPIYSQSELPANKLTYEPLYVFETNEGVALPPTVWAAKFAVDSVHAAMGKHSMTKYVDDAVKNPHLAQERIAKLERELFGNETELGDALAHREGVGYTGPSKIEES